MDSWDGLERLDLGHCEVLPVQGAPKEKSFWGGGENHGKILGNYEESIMNGGLLGKIIEKMVFQLAMFDFQRVDKS